MAEKKSSGMALKVVGAIVVIVVLVFLFKGMKKSPAQAPETPTGGPQPTAPQPGETTTGEVKEPIKPAETAAEVVKSEGLELVSNVFCDYSDKVVTFTLTNTMEKQLKIYQGEFNVLNPETAAYNTVRLAVNGRWPNPKLGRDIDCGGKFDLAPGETSTCTMKNVVLRSQDQVDRITGMMGQNVLNANNMNPAYKHNNDLDYFTCQA